MMVRVSVKGEAGSVMVGWHGALHDRSVAYWVTRAGLHEISILVSSKNRQDGVDAPTDLSMYVRYIYASSLDHISQQGRAKISEQSQ
jgi:hypothetical protein